MSTLCLDRKLHSFFDLGLKKGLNKTGFILVRFPLQPYLTTKFLESCTIHHLRYVIFSGGVPGMFRVMTLLFADCTVEPVTGSPFLS
ncbi:unnamed protein product [Bathycoccus prasinos]